MEREIKEENEPNTRIFYKSVFYYRNDTESAAWLRQARCWSAQPNPQPALQLSLSEGGGTSLFQLLDGEETWNSSFTHLP